MLYREAEEDEKRLTNLASKARAHIEMEYLNIQFNRCGRTTTAAVAVKKRALAWCTLCPVTTTHRAGSPYRAALSLVAKQKKTDKKNYTTKL